MTIHTQANVEGSGGNTKMCNNKTLPGGSEVDICQCVHRAMSEIGTVAVNSFVTDMYNSVVLKMWLSQAALKFKISKVCWF